MKWDPDQYLRFQSERFAPFRDVAGLIDARPGLRVVDLGCGTGELTAKLAGMLPESDVLGIDRSAEMLEKAQDLAAPGLRFEQASIEEVSGEFDLVFSHAALQWVPDHPSLLQRIWAMVAPGGQLAVQLPSNHSHRAFQLVNELRETAPFSDVLTGEEARPASLRIDEYGRILFELGGEDMTVFEKVYHHVLENADGIAEWMSGTALLPIFAALSDEMRADFMDRFRVGLRDAFPGSPVYYPFRRTIFYARKPG